MSDAPDVLEMATAYQRTAVVAAACECGIADALADGPVQAEAVAARLGLDPRAARALVGAMAALGLVERREGGHVLSAAGAPLASEHPRSVAAIVAKEWFFASAWTGLPQTIRDGHARVGPWAGRLAADPETSLAFLGALDDLAVRFGAGLPALVGPLPAGRLLDVGGGSGVHASAIRATNPGTEAVVLDLPPVEPLVKERHPELGFVGGDLNAPRFGRPSGERWQAVLLANVLHDHPPGRCAGIVREAAGLLAPDGVLVVYEWLLDENRDGPPDVALFALMMLVENEGGAAYTEAEICEWLAAAGMVDLRTAGDGGPISVVRGRRP